MAESTLTLTYTDLLSEVGLFLGWGADSSNWSTNQSTSVAACVDAGYRRFLRADGKHKWSFLRPVTSLTTTADDYDQDLPDAFGGLVGQGFYYADTTAGKTLIPKVPIGLVLDKRTQSTDSGLPLMAAIRTKTFDPTTGQRWEVLFWPAPDDTYTLYYKYRVLLNQMSTTNLYAIGGMEHSETVKEACLMVAEERHRDESNGLHKKLYGEQLVISIDRDQQDHSPSIYGYNSDLSDEILNDGTEMFGDRRATFTFTS